MWFVFLQTQSPNFHLHTGQSRQLDFSDALIEKSEELPLYGKQKFVHTIFWREEAGGVEIKERPKS